MIYLVGCYHALQYNKALRLLDMVKLTAAREQYASLIRTTISDKHISLLAEEFSESALEYLKAKSYLQEVARQTGIEHRFCDPNEAERTQIGLPSPFADTPDDAQLRINHTIREKYWLEKISDRLDSPTIFICGSDHIAGFTNILNSRSIENVIIREFCENDVL